MTDNTKPDPRDPDYSRTGMFVLHVRSLLEQAFSIEQNRRPHDG